MALADAASDPLHPSGDARSPASRHAHAWRDAAWASDLRATDKLVALVYGDHASTGPLLRHTYASWLLQDGVPLARVGALFGHVPPVTTQRCAHLDEAPADGVLAARDRRMPQTPGGDGTRPVEALRGHLRVAP